MDIDVYFSDLDQSAHWKATYGDRFEAGEVAAEVTIRAYKDIATGKWIEDDSADELIATPAAQKAAEDRARRDAKQAWLALDAEPGITA